MAERPLNATAASLLGFLHEGSKTGWDLVVTAQERIGKFWSITTSQVYRELAAMERAGLIEAGERGARERKPYTLTEDGRQAFADWIERDPGPENIRYPMLLTVAFGAHLPPERLAAMLDSHRAAHERQLAEYERDAAAHGSNRFALATLDFGIVYERAVLEWFDRVGNRLGQGQTGL
ncbi:PadR family transcriptional regulator [Rhodococcus wratislaviensis]|uniref:PadR family transcriptional regulator n=1 Tax=Rhodococcus wratislaviensis TaxID=44752 RepID=UPI0035125DB4